MNTDPLLDWKLRNPDDNNGNLKASLHNKKSGKDLALNILDRKECYGVSGAGKKRNIATV